MLETSGRMSTVVTSVSSDSHTWNLVYIQLLLEEVGHHVHNLGACVPDDVVIAECRRIRPDLVVVSSVTANRTATALGMFGRPIDRSTALGAAA